MEGFCEILPAIAEKIKPLGKLAVKRQTETQGVVSLWAATPLNVDPFFLPARYHIRLNGTINRLLKAENKISLSGYSVLIEKKALGKTTAYTRLNISDFSGVALRISMMDSETGAYAVSINLHHEIEEFCIPLHFAFNMNITGARIQTWSRILGLPILLPAIEGGWKMPENRMGSLKIKPAIPRYARDYMHKRKAILPGYRETGKLDPDKKVSGKEMFARR